ncbi:MAG: FmdB family transcriptional regulator [Blastocatellia bacterium]
MPIYEYKCKECDSYYEKRQAISEPPLRTCEKCNGELEKLISLSGFAFKGEGWYVTDYAGKNGKKPVSENGKSEKTNGAASTVSAESASNAQVAASGND